MDAQSLAYVYGRETGADADIAHVLTMDVARRIATNIAKLPNYLAASPEVHLDQWTASRHTQSAEGALSTEQAFSAA